MTYMHIQLSIGTAVILCILVEIFHANKLKLNGTYHKLVFKKIAELPN